MSRGLWGALLVLIGSPIISTLPQSTPLMQVDLLTWARTTEAGRMVGLAVVLVGLGLLASAWLRLCRAVAVQPDRVEALATVRLSVVVWSLPLLFAPPLFSRDGWSYAAQGVLTHVGLSPYAVGPGALLGPLTQGVDPRWMDTPAPYGPVPLIAGDLATSLTHDPWQLVICHRIIALTGLALLAWAVPRLASWAGVNPALASAVALASPLVMAHGVGGLHNDLLMVGLMAAGLVVARDRWVLGAVLCGLAAAVKLPGGLICVAIVLVSLPVAATAADRVRRTAQVGAVAVAALVVPGLLWGLGIGWVDALGVPGTLNTPLSMVTLVGGWLDGMGGLFGLPDDTMRGLLRVLGQLAILGIAGWVVMLFPTGRPVHALRAAALVMGATILLSPVVHLWYFLWATPFIAALRLPPVGNTAFVSASVIAGLVAPLDSSLHGAYLAIVFGSLMVAATTVILLVPWRTWLRTWVSSREPAGSVR